MGNDRCGQPSLCIPTDFQSVSAQVLNVGTAFASGGTGRREGFTGFQDTKCEVGIKAWSRSGFLDFCLGLLCSGLVGFTSGFGSFARRGCAADGALDVGTEKVENVSDAINRPVCELPGFEILLDGHDYGHEDVGSNSFLSHDVDAVGENVAVGAV